MCISSKSNIFLIILEIQNFIHQHFTPYITSFFSQIIIGNNPQAKCEFISQIFLTTLGNICLYSEKFAINLLRSNFLPSFLSNNINYLFTNDDILDPLLFLLKNLTYYLNPTNTESLDKSHINKLFSNQMTQQMNVLVFFAQDLILKDDKTPFLSEDNLEYLLQILINLISMPQIQPFFKILYRKPQDFAIFIDKIRGCLYNQKFGHIAMYLITNLANVTPVEEYHHFQPAKMFNAVSYILKMNQDDTFRKDVYFFLSNFVLNYQALKVILYNSVILGQIGADFVNSSDEVRFEILFLLGNICISLEPHLVPKILEHKILEIMKIGFDFNNQKLILLIIESYISFYKRFEYYQEEIDKLYLEKVLEFANDDDFLDQLTEFESIFYQKSSLNNCKNKSECVDIINKIYKLKQLIGIES